MKRKKDEVDTKQYEVAASWTTRWIKLFAICVILMLLIITLSAPLPSVYNVGMEKEKSWTDKVMDSIWHKEEEETPYLSRIGQAIWTLLYYFTSAVYYTIQYLNQKPSHPNPGTLSIQILFATILMGIAFVWLFHYFKSHKRDFTFRNAHTVNQQLFRIWSLFKKHFLILFILTVLISIPWEYIRLYQIEVSKKTAVAIKGMPAECQPENMSSWVALRSWIREQFSWSEEPCEQYHRAILVDPFWEITPLMVLSSLFTRCVTQPFETVGINFGLSFRALFSHIPAQWQPILMLLLAIFVIISLIMICGYRVSVPLMFSFQPGAVENSRAKAQRQTGIKSLMRWPKST